LFNTILQSQRDALSSQLSQADVINKIICGDALSVLKQLPGEFVDTCISSPPYFRCRDYKVKEQIGFEPIVSEYLIKLIAVFDQVKRVLKKKEAAGWF
jgi:DNA modification methylase